MNSANHSHLPVYGQRAQQLHDRQSVCAVKTARRLIGKQNSGLTQQLLGNGHALALSARKTFFFHSSNPSVCSVAEPEVGHDLVHSLLLFVPGKIDSHVCVEIQILTNSQRLFEHIFLRHIGHHALEAFPVLSHCAPIVKNAAQFVRRHRRGPTKYSSASTFPLRCRQ